MNAHRPLMSVESPTELAPLDRAERVLDFVERKAKLAELARQSERITPVTLKLSAALAREQESA